VYVLNGNHEILNVSGDFRYVTAGAFQESARFGRRLEELFGDVDATGGPRGDPANEDDAWETALRTRVGLFAPGGPLAQQFARHSTVLVVNDTVFAHGGLLPQHVSYGLERLNAGVSRWMLGESAEELEEALALAAGRSDSVVWNRQFAKERWRTPAERYRQCNILRQVLALVPGAKRLVVGHTPQQGGCNCECDGSVRWRGTRCRRARGLTRPRLRRGACPPRPARPAPGVAHRRGPVARRPGGGAAGAGD
jgi:hypothetical protein